jgi:hypothetical protein
MIADQLLRVADNQDIGGTGAYTKLTDVVDLDTIRNIGVGTPLYFRVRFNTLYTQSPAGGSNIVMYYGEDASLAGGVLCGQIPFGSTGLPAQGTVFYLPIPPIDKNRLAIPGNGLKKYIGLVWEGYTPTSVIANAFWTVDIVTEVNMVEQNYGKDATFKVV